jgi:hypothetical protein
MNSLSVICLWFKKGFAAYSSDQHQRGYYNFPMKTPILGSLLVLVAAMVIGCGMKGELVIPSDPESKDRTKFPDVLIPSPKP